MVPLWPGLSGDCGSHNRGLCEPRAPLYSPPLMSLLQPGTTLGPYAIVSQLGSGGMGVVYLAHDPRLDRSGAR